MHANVPLTIEMRYLNNTRGEVKDLVESYTSIPASVKLRYKTGIGYYYDVQINRLLLWLLGQEKLEDKRCLWTHLSIPVKNFSFEAFQLLEAAWFDWYQWWYMRFPKS